MSPQRTQEQREPATNGRAVSRDEPPVVGADDAVIMPDEFYRQFVAREDGWALLEKLSQIDRAPQAAAKAARDRPAARARRAPVWPKTDPS